MNIDLICESNKKMTLLGNSGSVFPTLTNGFTTVDIIGLTSLSTSISSVENVGVDGDRVSNTHVPARNVTIILRLKNDPNHGADVAAVTNLIKGAFPLGSTARLVTVEESTKTLTGMVERVERPRFGDGSPSLAMEIGLYCSDPFFRGTPVIINSETASQSLNNPGEYPGGLKIEATANQTNAALPYFALTQNGKTQFFRATSDVMNSGDILEISTTPGEKHCFVYRANLEQTVDYTAHLDDGSTWLQIAPGNATIQAVGNNGRTIPFPIKYTIVPRYL